MLHDPSVPKSFAWDQYYHTTFEVKIRKFDRVIITPFVVVGQLSVVAILNLFARSRTGGVLSAHLPGWVRSESSGSGESPTL